MESEKEKGEKEEAVCVFMREEKSIIDNVRSFIGTRKVVSCFFLRESVVSHFSAGPTCVV